eukprot:gene34813-42161_t
MAGYIVLQGETKGPIAAGPSFVAFRNRPGHTYSHEAQLRSALGQLTQPYSQKFLRYQANERSRFFQAFIPTPPVPSHMLYATLAEEWTDTANLYNSVKHSTVACVRHMDQNLVLFRSGEHGDEVTLLHADYIKSPALEAAPTFSLNVGRGSAIRHICSAGMSSCSTASSVLVGSRYEVTLLSTEAVEGREPSSVSSHLHILRPLQQFRLPDEILDMAASMTSHSYGYILTKRQGVFAYTPDGGVRASPFPTHIPVDSLFALSASLHPKVFYALSRGGWAGSVDVRSGKVAITLESAGLTTTTTTTSTSTTSHPRKATGLVWRDLAACTAQPHEVLLTCPSETRVVDERAARQPLQRRLGV